MTGRAMVWGGFASRRSFKWAGFLELCLAMRIFACRPTEAMDSSVFSETICSEKLPISWESLDLLHGWLSRRFPPIRTFLPFSHCTCSRVVSEEHETMIVVYFDSLSVLSCNALSRCSAVTRPLLCSCTVPVGYLSVWHDHLVRKTAKPLPSSESSYCRPLRVADLLMCHQGGLLESEPRQPSSFFSLALAINFACCIIS